MKTPEFDETKKLEVDFKAVRYGIIYFTLTLGEKSFGTIFSEVFDPLQNFRKWLEAISIGVHQCSFWYDPEGTETKFNFERISFKRELFAVSYYYDDSDVFLSGYIERRQLVEEFYFGFLNFCNSPKFEKYQWESKPFAEHLTNLFGTDYKTLLTDLSKFSGKQLKYFLCKTDPRIRESMPTNDEKADLAILLKTGLSTCEKTFNPKSDNSELWWNMPTDYNDWSIDKKRKLVEECLSENCSCYNGIKIADFKSPIVEGVLRNF